MALFQTNNEQPRRKRGIEKYVDDYTIEYYTDKKGNEKKRAVYVGPHIGILEDDKSLCIKLTAPVITSFLAVAAVLWSLLGQHATMSWFGTVLPQAAALFPCMYVAFGLPNLPYKGKEMQRDQYMNGIIRLLNCFGAISAIMAVLLVAEVVYRATRSDWLFLKGDILFLVKIVLAIVLSIVTIVILRSIDVDETALARERLEQNQK